MCSAQIRKHTLIVCKDILSYIVVYYGRLYLMCTRLIVPKNFTQAQFVLVPNKRARLTQGADEGGRGM